MHACMYVHARIYTYATAPKALLLLGGGTRGFSSVRENMHFFIQDKRLLGGDACPSRLLGGGGGVAPSTPASGAYVRICMCVCMFVGVCIHVRNTCVCR